jgi:hypothetical protein
MLAFIPPASLNTLFSTQCFLQPGATWFVHVDRDELLRTNYHDTRLASSGARCSMARIRLAATHTMLWEAWNAANFNLRRVRLVEIADVWPSPSTCFRFHAVVRYNLSFPREVNPYLGQSPLFHRRFHEPVRAHEHPRGG